MTRRDRMIALMAGQRREAAANRGTVMVATARRERRGTTDFEGPFVSHYARFRDHVRSFEAPGVAVVAIDRARGALAGVACVAARIGEPSSLIVGRHSEAQLLLRGDDAISLRHLAVIVEPVADFRPGRGVTYRVMDLRSSAGFESESGESLAAIRSDGVAFLATASHLLYFFLTGDPTDWPERARDAWSFIPERVYLEERVRTADGSGRHRQAPPAAGPSLRSITIIERVPGPSRAELGSLVGDGEEPVAEVAVSSGGRCQRIPVGAAAIADGILFGRASRCDAAAVFQRPSLSRVHLLVIAINGTLYAIDTASTNGSHLQPDGEAPFQLAPLRDRAPVYLGSSAALCWRWRGEPLTGPPSRPEQARRGLSTLALAGPLSG